MKLSVAWTCACVLVIGSFGAPPHTLAEDLVVNGGTMELSGVVDKYDHICVINGGTINVKAFDGSDKTGSGNLELIAASVYVDGTSTINARGKGYTTPRCGNGAGPNGTAGGRGGCSVMDSAGGGAHFGRGGRGTVDAPTTAGPIWRGTFPTAFEDDCNISYVPPTLPATSGVCALTGDPPIGQTESSRTYCWNSTLHGRDVRKVDSTTCTTPPCTGASVAGLPYWHNIYSREFGAAGGEKGCRDGDGTGTAEPQTGGAGGGRVVLVGLANGKHANGTAQAPAMCGAVRLNKGNVRVDGKIDAGGKRGCGYGNDSGGGGAGGSVMIVGDNVVVTSSARVSAAGGLGGDGTAGATDPSDCPGAQTAGACDDCGGGGGGGIISVLSVTRDLQAGPVSQFNVNGALGGVCTICKGEAGGGAGELQLDGAYVGEFCDGFDNDFDGNVDENLGTQTCGLGNCRKTIDNCTAGSPVVCVPDVAADDPTCVAEANGARPRVAVIVDTSASMLLDLAGKYTFGDGSAEHAGISTTGTAATTDSRLYLATAALAEVISAYPEIDFALSRYHQDQGVNRSCQTATWFECQGLVASYDDPTDNTGATQTCVPLEMTDANYPLPAIKQVPGPNASSTTECINYAGSCGAPRRGGDVLSGFGSKTRDIVRWLDHQETKFNASTKVGDVCLHSEGNDCELRGSGPTPLAGSLLAIDDYVSPIRTTDPAARPTDTKPNGCRGYSVILVTDGAESCNGNPVAAATTLKNKGIKTSVVAVSVKPEEVASLNAIAAAGNTGAAVLVSQPDKLVPALTAIINGSIVTETCNGEDDDCDGKIDEDYPGLGTACDDRMKGICRSEGMIACNAAGTGTECKITSTGMSMKDEECNNFDDDCDGAIDEGLDCEDMSCDGAPNAVDICNGKDDDCDGKIDESDPMINKSCGLNKGECLPGYWRCVLGAPLCVGDTKPMAEQCNGRDDDCDGVIDDDAPCPDPTRCIEGACRNPCGQSEFSCPSGQLCEAVEAPSGQYCLPRDCALCSANEVCLEDKCVDPCTGLECPEDEFCVGGKCRDCTVAGCAQNQVCFDKRCQSNPCDGVTCSDKELCYNGACQPTCDDRLCPTGQVCDAQGVCSSNPCNGVVCGSGELCRDGTCVENRCESLGGALCASGDTCAPYVGCVANPCAVTTCAIGTVCNVTAAGEPRCILNGTPVKESPPNVVSTGGSGLTTCSVERVGSKQSNAATLAGWLFLCVALVRLRRSRTRTMQQAGSETLRRYGWLGLCTFLFGCETSAICLDCARTDASTIRRDTGADDDDGSVDEADGGDGPPTGYSGSDAPPALTCTNLGAEVCNRLDDDCDRRVDEDFDFANNVRHCGGCDQPCRADNALAECKDGVCVVGACAAGYVNLDSSKSGCEYRCPVFPSSGEDCNGLDDDCDGRVDEDVTPPPAENRCKHTTGTPCEGVKLVCDTRENQTTWFCDFPATVDFDRAIPDGAIPPEETRCDGADNDCDGVIDEPWPELGEPCDDGKIGACRNGGAVVCQPDQISAACDLSLPPNPLPGAGPDAAELCNNLDDNCDGIVDNPRYKSDGTLDDKRVVDDMVAVPGKGFYVDTYEASRPDANGDTAGIRSERACSKANALPWSLVSYTQAAAACEAASGGTTDPTKKKHLCTAAEWLAACESSPARTYPYGNAYDANTCNGADHDTDGSAGGIQNSVMPTGSMASCKSVPGAFDLSGNLKEWTSQAGEGSGNYVVRGGSFESPRLGLTCATTLSQAAGATVLGGLGFRCCSNTGP